MHVSFQFTNSSKSIQTTSGHVFNVIILVYRLNVVHIYFKQADDTFVTEAESFNSVVQPTPHMAAMSWQFARTTLRSFGYKSNTTPHITLALTDTISSSNTVSSREFIRVIMF